MVHLNLRPLLSTTAVLLLMTSLLLASTSVVRGPDTTPPEVISFYPPDHGKNTPLDALIYLNFSEAVNISSFNITTQPAITFAPFVWSASDMSVVVSHAVPFLAATKYVATVNVKDKADNWLDGNHDGNGGDPFTWIFWTSCGGACIVETDPADGEVSVPVTSPIIIMFSEPMASMTLSIAISPPLSGLAFNWNPNNDVVTISHDPFSECAVYNVTVDSPSLVPGPVPNPWLFTTVGGCLPMIMHIEPPETNASISAPIVVEFSTEMNLDAVTWVLNSTVVLDASWSGDNQTLTLTHAEKFHPCTAYSVTISGEDTTGNPLVPGPVRNPYNFTTVCTYPRVTQTSPFDRQNNVLLDTPISVTFSESMDNDSVEDSFSYSDDTMTIFTKSDGVFQWNADNTTFAFSPNAPFHANATYTVKLDASLAHGLGGNYLDGNANGFIDYPRNADNYAWQFTTALANDNTAPFVQSVYPEDGATEVALDVFASVVFSETMNRLSVENAIEISDYKFADDFSWPNNRTVNFRVAPPLFYGMPYTITVKTSASDLVGNHMTEAYAWSFTTAYWRGDIYGRVVDEADGTPIADANVELNGIQTITDSQGNFTLRNVRQGNYMLNVTKEGYEDEHSMKEVTNVLRDMGIMKLRKVVVQSHPEVGVIFIVAAIAIAIIFLALLMMAATKRRKPPPARFEQWKGEVAEVETGEQER